MRRLLKFIRDVWNDIENDEIYPEIGNDEYDP
jgi:hypothetical protein